ncbi:glycosyltransferase family 1 protein [Aquabacterium sp.]|uniref:glycosyltransferase family 4 protein n=1 Tax=Aquabacterium sp. TaxID=1872578 RepID=UPI0025C05660|nr:glycosyltransferase family 1 protein [Aquabacterium sp.]
MPSNERYQVYISAAWVDKPRGIGTYVRELIQALDEAEMVASGNLFVTCVVPANAKFPETKKWKNIEFIRVTEAPYPIWENVVMPFLAKRGGAHLVHYPGNTVPLIRSKAKVVATVHDLIFMDDLGKGVYQNFGNIYRRLMISRVKSTASEILTVSYESARLIRARICRSASVAYITSPFSPKTNCSSWAERRYGPVLHVGGIAPHKNTRAVVSAYEKLDLPNSLIVLGVPSDSSMAKELGGRKVKFPGWISAVDLDALYSAASVLLFPSLKEGFGLPILEAFAYGVPVITSDLNPMKEVAGGGAILVNPIFVEDIASALSRVLSDEATWENCVKNGIERSKDFSRANMGRRVIAAYISALNAPADV